MKQFRRILTIVLLFVFLSSSAVLACQSFQRQESEASLQNAKELAALPDTPAIPSQAQPLQAESGLTDALLHSLQTTPETLQEAVRVLTDTPQLIARSRDITSWLPVLDDANAGSLLSIDIGALQATSPDVLGWFLIPGTSISYPLLQGEDNTHYLNFTWDNRESFVGSIFMECTNSSSLSDFNTIIYGHNLGDTHMFSTLPSYGLQSHWSEHPYIYIVTENGAFRYRIFAAYQTAVDSNTFRLRFQGPEPKQAYLDESIAQSVIDTGITPTVNDRILTLSTCVRGQQDSRWIVQSLLEGQLSAA